MVLAKVLSQIDKISNSLVLGFKFHNFHNKKKTCPPPQFLHICFYRKRKRNKLCKNVEDKLSENE